MVVLHPQISKRALGYQIPPEVLCQLRRTPWCLSTLEDPSFIALDSPHRNPPPQHPGRTPFMSQILKTPETIALWQSFYRPSSSSDGDYGEARVLIELGSGVDGHLHTAHGGIVTTILDEVMGTVGYIHRTPGIQIFTAFMRVDYRSPLPTPALIMGRAKLDGSRSSGRKIFVEATLEGGDGTVYTAAEALFIEASSKIAKL